MSESVKVSFLERLIDRAINIETYRILLQSFSGYIVYLTEIVFYEYLIFWFSQALRSD